jgi:hypothetical protein
MNKQEYIQSLKDEVKQFHPFLRSLFIAMVNKDVLINVDYTHGPNELGADFILTKRDSILGENTAISVIVKTGSLRNALGEVERQIEESKAPRKDQNGNVVFVREFWVVTNSTISNNTRTLIQEKFKNLNIVFWDDSRIETACNSFLGDDWNTSRHSTKNFLADRKKFFTNAIERNSLIQVADDFPLRQTIIERHTSYNQNKTKNKSAQKINILEFVKTKKMMLLEGGFGSGKTRILNQLGVDLCIDKSVGTTFIPVYITFEDLCAKYDLDIDNIINDVVNEDVRKEIQNEVQYIFLVDGVDEANVSDYDKSAQIFEFSRRIESKNIHALLTTRNIAPLFKKEERLKFDCKMLEIQPLSTTEIIKYIMQVCKKDKLLNRIYSDINESDLFKDLAKIPITAILFARILKENVQDLPSTLPELFAKFTELSLGKWDVDKGFLGQKEYEAMDTVASEIAKYMFENGLPRIGESETRIFFERYINKRNTGLNVEDLYSRFVNETGLIALYDGCVSFKHRSIMEFLYAKKLSKNKDLPIEKKMLTLKWQTVYYFYYGCLKDCSNEILQFSNLECGNNLEKMMKLSCAPSFLLAAYNTPYEDIKNVLKKTIGDAGNIYLSMKNDAECPLQNLSEMNFLWLFQIILRNCYSYNFFAEYFDQCILDYVGHSLSEKDAYSAFFISMIRATLKLDTPMDFIFENQDKLPTPIKLGLYHEISAEKDKASKKMSEPELSNRALIFMKKIANKLKTRSLVKKTKYVAADYLKILYEEPLKKKG